jgi:hypothetical protein
VFETDFEWEAAIDYLLIASSILAMTILLASVVLCGLVARRVAAAVREDIPYPITGADLRLDLMIGSDECLKLAPPTGVEFEQKGEYLVAVVVWAPSGVTEIC